MNILITNDDGITAQGILSLAEAAAEFGDVYIVAPDTQKSACGHGITMHIPLVVKEVEVPFAKRAWSASGTPADCIKLGIKELVKDVDLVLSGTNMGANLGNDCFYSGTVSGAAEGVFCGKPSAAVSICSHHPHNFAPSIQMAKEVINKINEKGLPDGAMLNVNLPDVPAEEIKGVRITTLGRVSYEEKFQWGISNLGSKFYWYTGGAIKQPQKENSDIQAIRDKYVSITPLHFDITDYSRIEAVKAWNFEF